GEHHAALHPEQNRQKQRQQPGDADDYSIVQGDAVDLVLVGFGFPQVELIELVRAQLEHIGHHAAGIERDAKYIGRRAVLPLGPLAARSDARNARTAEVGPEDARTDHAIMWDDDEALDLLVAGIGQRKYGPIAVALARTHVHAADDAVRSGRGRYQQAIAFGAVALDRIGEIDRRCVGTHADGFDRARRHQANNEG